MLETQQPPTRRVWKISVPWVLIALSVRCASYNAYTA